MKYLKYFLLVLVALAIGAPKCNADRQLWKAKNKTGRALVAVDAAWDKFYKAEAERIADEIIEAHEGDPAWSLNIAEQDFELALAPLEEHNKRFERAVSATASALEAFEQILNAKDKIDKGQAYRTMRDIVDALVDIQDCLLAAGVKVPNKLTGALTFIDNLLPPDPD